ncbi:MAG TPA: glycosyltransferase family 4 protein, partial [Dongiaceae bacterium]|nr:glycosyltransferase family 4 protein [Dongiaceae bacterium]
PELDRAARQQFIRRCDRILVHCEAGRRELEQTFHHLPPATIAPHPDYRREYPAPAGRMEARAALRIPRDDFVFLMFGMLRPYKNFPLAISAFRALPMSRARLLIAGGTLGGDDAAWLKQLAAGDERIDLRVARVPDDQVPVLFGAADVALFSYERILASGGVALAQGLGRAIVAPRIGCLPDMVPDSSGLLYEVNSVEGLAAAMRRITELDVDEMGRQGQLHIAKRSPEAFARTLFGVYKALPRR